MLFSNKVIFVLSFWSFTIIAHAQQIGKKTIIDPFNYSIQKDFSGSNGSVVCAHPLAAKVGVDILKQRGNAVDAAIAVQLALAVVYPDAGNLGGGGFMVARMANGKAIALDFREVAPDKASEDMYLDKATGKANLALSQSGRLAAGVPGTVAGIFAAMKYAKLPFRALIQPAIELAGHGFVITQREADNLNNTAKEFEENNASLPALLRKNGRWKAGDTLIQKELARTLTRIRDNGVKEFYEGETAKLIVNEMQRGGGIISLHDLKNYKVKATEPCEFDYKGYHIITMPLPSSGGVLLQQMLKMLEHRPLQQYGFETVRSVQLYSARDKKVIC